MMCQWESEADACQECPRLFLSFSQACISDRLCKAPALSQVLHFPDLRKDGQALHSSFFWTAKQTPYFSGIFPEAVRIEPNFRLERNGEEEEYAVYV